MGERPGTDKAAANNESGVRKPKATRSAYGEALLELGKNNPNVVALDADLSGSTKTSSFAKAFPDRFVNVGIAEADMIGTAAGFAKAGKVPFASTFAVFATGRAWDQIRLVVCYSSWSPPSMKCNWRRWKRSCRVLRRS